MLTNPQQIQSGLEGAYVCEFLQKSLNDSDIYNKNVLEIGPKHGMHTLLLDSYRPKSITLIELPSKKETIDQWINTVKSPFNLHYDDFLRFKTNDKFDLILCCGVLYHNTEQLRILKKLRSLASINAKFICECSTTRNPDLESKHIIEVLYPNGYRNVPTIMFMPSKMALRSLISMAEWDILTSTDDLIITEPHDHRLTLVATASKRIHTSYSFTDINHTHIDNEE